MRAIALIAALFVGCVSVGAQESITLSAPIPSVNAYAPGSLLIELSPRPVIAVVLVHEASGRQERFVYPCASPCVMDTEAAVAKMIAALNSANLTTRSLWRRLFDRLLQDFPERFKGGAKVE